MVQNLKSTSLLSTAYKTYSVVLNKRLEKGVKEMKLLPQIQVGFLKSRGTICARN